MRSRMRVLRWSGAAMIGVLAVIASRCSPNQSSSAGRANASDVAAAAQKTYVAPGDLDEYYMFSSGAIPVRCSCTACRRCVTW